MQASHQPDIKNIEGIIARFGNSKGAARRAQREKLPMLGRKIPAIRQMDEEWHERLRIVILPDGIYCHVVPYSTPGRRSQAADVQCKDGAGERLATMFEIPAVESPETALKAAIAAEVRWKK
jgi:hypothetical protein